MKCTLTRHARIRVKQRLRATPGQVVRSISNGAGVGLWYQ